MEENIFLNDFIVDLFTNFTILICLEHHMFILLKNLHNDANSINVLSYRSRIEAIPVVIEHVSKNNHHFINRLPNI